MPNSHALPVLSSKETNIGIGEHNNQTNLSYSVEIHFYLS